MPLFHPSWILVLYFHMIQQFAHAITLGHQIYPFSCLKWGLDRAAKTVLTSHITSCEVNEVPSDLGIPFRKLIVDNFNQSLLRTMQFIHKQVYSPSGFVSHYFFLVSWLHNFCKTFATQFEQSHQWLNIRKVFCDLKGFQDLSFQLVYISAIEFYT